MNMRKIRLDTLIDDVEKFTAIVKEVKEKYYSDPVQENIIDGVEFSLFYPTKYNDDHIYNRTDIAKALYILCMEKESRIEFFMTFVHLLRICVEDFPMEFKYHIKNNEISHPTRAGETLHELYNDYYRDLLECLRF